MSLRPQACSRHWHVARKTLKRHVLCSFPLWLEMAHTNCSPWCSHCNPAVGLGSVQDHLLETLHLLWMWKSGYKLKPLWEGPSTPGFLIPNMPFSSWAAIPFSVLFFPRCSLFPFPNVAQEAETWSFLQTWPQCCCCGAAKGSRRVAQPHLCALWRIFVCLGPFRHLSCYMLGMNHFPQHLCSLMWAVTNQTKQVLSLFHPLYVCFRTSRQTPAVGTVCGVKQEVWDDVQKMLCQSQRRRMRCVSPPPVTRVVQMCPCGCWDVMLTEIFAVVLLCQG